MSDYQIQVAEPAEAEIDAAFQRMFLLSPVAAERFRDGIARAIRSLSQMPHRCVLAPENGWLDHEVRQLIFRSGRSTYRILFTIFEAAEDMPALVRILRVRHGAQKRFNEQVHLDQNQEDSL